MFQLLEPFSEDVVDVDAATIRKSHQAKPMLEENPLAETSPSVFTDAGGHPRAEAKKERRYSEKESQRFQTKRRSQRVHALSRRIRVVTFAV